MAQKKMSRPTDDPKTRRFEIRLSENDFSILEEYCKSNNITSSEAIRRGIKLLAEKE